MAHKLLLADDSVTIQRVIELTFADEDVQVIAVGDGRQAIEQIQRDRPDIVLADIGMPERDGYEVAAFIKGDTELAHIPVLLLTGAFEPIDDARAKAAGCDGVLVKPFEPQMVISRVKDLLANRKPVSLWPSTPPAAPKVSIGLPAPVMADFDRIDPAGPDPQPAPEGSLEDYFDRLDAAFATLEGGQTGPTLSSLVTKPAAMSEPVSEADAASPSPVDSDAPFSSPSSSFRTADALDGWDPDLSGEPEHQGAAIELPREEEADPAAAIPAPERPAVEAHLPATAAPEPEPAPAFTHVQQMPAGPMPSMAQAFAALLAAEQGQHFSPVVVPAQAMPDQVIEDIVRRVIERMSEQAVRETVVDVAERLVREEIARIKGFPAS